MQVRVFSGQSVIKYIQNHNSLIEDDLIHTKYIA